jgi:hypothetical protein
MKNLSFSKQNFALASAAILKFFRRNPIFHLTKADLNELDIPKGSGTF